MSESDRHKRPGGKPDGARPDRGGPAKGAPRSSSPPRRDSGEPRRDDAPRRDSAPRRDDTPRRDSAPRRDDAPRRDGSAPRRDNGGPRRDGASGGRGRDDQRVWTKGGAPARGDRSAREREPVEDRDPYGTQSVRNRHDDPFVPADVKPDQLDRVARAQLKTLAKENADVVATHMVMAARLIEEDPELAHQHATSAARKAGRIAVVRETLAITAYAVGDFALALRELRTYRRISGRDDQLPMMVDSERGLGRPDRALELGRSVDRSTLPNDVQVELAIAMSGARLDLEQLDAALAELQIPQLDPDRAFSWSPALFAAYAAVLEDLGRVDDAAVWFRRADVAADALDAGEDSTDEDVIEVFEEDLGEDPEAEAGDAGPDDGEGGAGSDGEGVVAGDADDRDAGNGRTSGD